MPSSASWVLASSPTISPFSPSGTSIPPIIGSAVECDVDVYTQDELLGVVERSYPVEYIDALKRKQDGGYEIFQAAAKVGERCSIAIGRWFCCSFLMHAHDGDRAVGTVEFYREELMPEWVSSAYWIKKGSVVRTESGKEFLTLEDIFMDSGEFQALNVMAVEAITEGYAWNVPGQVTTAGGEVLPGDINDIKKAILIEDDAAGSPAIDVYLKVRNVAPTTGGADKCLDAIGQDVGMPRNVGESADAYRLRIATTPDAVSPEAIRRGVNALLAPYDSAVCLREVGTDLLPGFFYDAPPSSDPRRNFAYDMDFTLRPEDRFKLYLSTLDFRGFFLLGVPRIIETEYTGLFYDGAIGDPFELDNAYDTTAADAKNGGYDGFLQMSTSIYKSISDAVSGKKAGGVGFDLYIEEIGCF